MIYDIYTIWLREMIRFLRARSRIVSSLAMPFFWLALAGTGLSSSFSLPSVNYISFLAPGIIGMIILFTSIFSGVSVIWDRQFGFLKEILVAPISRTSIVLGKTAGGTTVAVVNGLVMLLIISIMGLIPLGIGIFTGIIFMILSAMCFVSFGLIIASQLKSMEGFQAIMSFLVMPVFFLSGALFPLENTPLWMRAVSYIDPLRYGVDGLRGSLVGISIFPIWLNLTALAVLSILIVLTGSYLFRKAS